MCCMCLSYPEKSSNRTDPRLQHAIASHVQMCIFSSQLANICTRVGMPTVPYWLPAVTQEDRKMEDREREGGRGDKGSGDDVRTRAPRLSFSLVSHLSI